VTVGGKQIRSHIFYQIEMLALAYVSTGVSGEMIGVSSSLLPLVHWDSRVRIDVTVGGKQIRREIEIEIEIESGGVGQRELRLI
jgi:hypothetical protein